MNEETKQVILMWMGKMEEKTGQIADLLHRMAKAQEDIRDVICEMWETSKKEKKALEESAKREKIAPDTFNDLRMYLLNALDMLMIDIIREDVGRLQQSDRDTEEYKRGLIEILKRLRELVKIRRIVKELFTEESIDRIIESLENELEGGEQ